MPPNDAALVLGTPEFDAALARGPQDVVTRVGDKDNCRVRVYGKYPDDPRTNSYNHYAVRIFGGDQDSRELHVLDQGMVFGIAPTGLAIGRPLTLAEFCHWMEEIDDDRSYTTCLDIAHIGLLPRVDDLESFFAGHKLEALQGTYLLIDDNLIALVSYWHMVAEVIIERSVRAK